MIRGVGKVVLGVSIGERAIHVAELSGVREKARLVRCATLELPASVTWEKPAEVGAALKAFLRDRKFEAKAAVAGLPGRWVLVKPMTLPPASAAAAAGALRLMAEREYQADAREWAMDYSGTPLSSEKSTVLLAATPKQRLSRVLDALKAADLQVVCATVTTLALASAKPASEAPGGAVLSVAHDGAELAVRSRGRVVALERLPISVGPLMDGEMRRLLSSGQHGDASSAAITAWDQTGIPQADLTRLGERVGMPMRINPSSHELGVLNGTPGSSGFTPATAGAVALGLLVSAESPGIDFLSSRMAPPAPTRWTRPRLLAAIAIAALLVYFLYLVGDWYSERREVDDLREQQETIKLPYEAAKLNVDRYTRVRGWYDKRPAMLDAMRSVTQAFPGNGEVWATSITVRDDHTVTLVGRAQSNRAASDLPDRLRKSTAFENVKIVYIRQADRTSNGVTFAITFTLKAKE